MPRHRYRRGEEVFALGGAGRPDRLLSGMRMRGGYFRTVASTSTALWLMTGRARTLAALTKARARGIG